MSQPDTKGSPVFGKRASTDSSAFQASPTKGNPNDTTGKTGSDRKRSRQSSLPDEPIDDILSQITSKLNALSTGNTEQERKESNIRAFIEVLGGTFDEADFYLDSAAWDIQTAVYLWLEHNPRPAPTYSQPPSASAGFFYPPSRQTKCTQSYNGRTVNIEGLPAGWSAHVSKSSGQIYFFHISSGLTQFAVPPGFDDTPSFGFEDTGEGPVADSSGSSSSSSSSSINPQGARSRTGSLSDGCSALSVIDGGEKGDAGNDASGTAIFCTSATTAVPTGTVGASGIHSILAPTYDNLSVAATLASGHSYDEWNVGEDVLHDVTNLNTSVNSRPRATSAPPLDQSMITISTRRSDGSADASDL